MALTKTQINYLEQKLNRTVDDKISNFKRSFGTQSKQDLIMEGLKDGSIKLISETEIIKKFDEFSNGSYYYTPSISLTELINEKELKRIEEVIEERQTKINDYSNKLYDAKRDALDKIVLEGVDVETAIAELNKIK